MKLYDNAFSPYAFKVRAVVYEKHLPVEHREIRSETQRAELLAVSPRGEVPALVDGDTAVYDSTIICEYLEERHPTPPLLPADAAGRARARAIERIADTQVDPLVIVLGMAKVMRPEVGKSHPDAIVQAAGALARQWSALDAMLGDREWFVGSFSRADIAVAAHMAGAVFMGDGPTAATPALAAWVERALARPSIARAAGEALAAYNESLTNPDPFFTTKRLHWRDCRLEWAIRCGLGPWLLAEIAGGRAFFSPLP
jgi:glutathione S-transferase/RNA polymerase-associated protein